MTTCRLLSFVLLSAFPCQAGLQVESPKSEVTVPLGARQIDTTFTLRNTGSSVVNLQRIEANCPCVSTKSDTMVLLPGEKATLTAEFEIGDRQGSQRKRIVVYSDDPKDSVITLRWNVEVPRTAKIQPGFLLWSAGSKPEAKTVSVESLLPETKLNIPKSELPYKASLTAAGGKAWNIEVIPDRTDVPGISSLPLQLTLPDGSQISLKLRLVISQ